MAELAMEAEPEGEPESRDFSKLCEDELALALPPVEAVAEVVAGVAVDDYQ